MVKKRLGKQQSMMTQIWLVLALSAFVFAMFQNQLAGLNRAIVDSAKGAVTLAISLAGITALWLGLVKIIEQAGFMERLAQVIGPLIRRLFPEIPADHPANSAMTLSFAANLLGLSNAATPFGLKVMGFLHRLNPVKGTASNSMCLFLAITTSGLAVLPTGVISIRMIAGAQNPAAILIPTWISTGTATLVAIASCLVLRRYFPITQADKAAAEEIGDIAETSVLAPPDIYPNAPATPWKRYVSLAFFLAVGAVLVNQIFVWSPSQRTAACLSGQNLSAGQIEKIGQCTAASPEGGALVAMECLKSALGGPGPSKEQAACLNDSIMNMLSSLWMIPLLLMWFVLYGWVREIDIYPAMVGGMKEGLQVIVYIIPFLLSIFLAMGLFRASGAMDAVTDIYSMALESIGFSAGVVPAEVLPVALTRPLSGSGAGALMMEIVYNDPDSFAAFMASVMTGSTDTTFYILAVYFGSVGVVRVRYAVLAGLLADFSGLCAAVVSSHMFY